MFCGKCGKEFDTGASFCPYCGNVIKKVSVNTTISEQPKETKSKKQKSSVGLKIVCVIMAIIIAAMGSYIGVDYFKNKSNNKLTNEGNEINVDPVDEKNIEKAITALTEYWEDVYEESEKTYESEDLVKDNHLEIVYTRVLEIDPDESFSNSVENGEKIKYIIEFTLHTNYFFSSPYYFNSWVYDNVVIYSNGEMEVASHIINYYRAKTYTSDFSGFIVDIREYGSKFNRVIKID